MPLDLLDIPALKARLLKNLETSATTGLFLPPLVKQYNLLPADVDALIRRLTADDRLRLGSPWTSTDGGVREVSFTRVDPD